LNRMAKRDYGSMKRNFCEARAGVEKGHCGDYQRTQPESGQAPHLIENPQRLRDIHSLLRDLSMHQQRHHNLHRRHEAEDEHLLSWATVEMIAMTHLS